MEVADLSDPSDLLEGMIDLIAEVTPALEEAALEAMASQKERGALSRTCRPFCAS
jgi:hypothetical protein